LASDGSRLDRHLWWTYARCPGLLVLLYALLRLLIELLIIRGRPAPDRDLELLVLRQELLVLRRTARRPRWRTAERMILAVTRPLASGERPAPGAAGHDLCWHRALVRRRWSAFGRRRDPERRALHI